jgi:hypothetical protein
MLTYGGQIELFETSLRDLINIPETFPMADLETLTVFQQVLK